MKTWVTRAAGLVLAMNLLGGCASGSSSTAKDGWTKPGSTDEQRGRDTLSCINESGGPGQVNQTRYRQCMRSLGYSEVPPQ